MKKITDILDAAEQVNAYKVVIFDMDDTLYSEKEYVKSGYREIEKLCPEIDEMYSKLWNAFLAKKSAIDFVLKEEGLYSPEKVSECLTAYREQEPDIHLYDGVRDMLSVLKARGHKLGMITDGRPDGQRAKIRALGLEKYFDKIIITDELGGVQYRKPSFVAFEKMKDFFGIDYSEMVYIGDNPKKDFIAPEKLGMAAIYFKNSDGLYSDK